MMRSTMMTYRSSLSRLISTLRARIAAWLIRFWAYANEPAPSAPSTDALDALDEFYASDEPDESPIDFY